MARKVKQEKHEPLETQLWHAADKLSKYIDTAEYKHFVLGAISSNISATRWKNSVFKFAFHAN